MDNLPLDFQPNGFHFHHCKPPPSTTYTPSPRRNNHHHDTIFPPFNHEDLPLPPPPPLPPPQTPPSSQTPNSNPHSYVSQNKPQLFKWFDFALHYWNSKLFSIFTRIGSSGYFSYLVPLASAASFLAFLWFFFRRRRRFRRGGGKDSVERLKLVIKDKDEKIVQLLEQIAQLNKVLLARYKVPVLRAS